MVTKPRFADKVVLILGGNSGIGLAAAKGFAAEGAKVIVTGRNEATLADVSRNLGVAAIRSDIASTTETRALIEQVENEFGGIDVLFVNAGIGGFVPLADLSEQFWDEILAVNLRGAVFAVKSALPVIRDGGAIVITGSIGAVMAVEGNIAYAAAKAGLRAAARIMAKELLPRRIRVNLISPGPIDTEIFKRDATPEEIQQTRDLMATLVPMGRMGSSEEAAKAAIFLASEDSSFINGVDLLVDGGCVEL